MTGIRAAAALCELLDAIEDAYQRHSCHGGEGGGGNDCFGCLLHDRLPAVRQRLQPTAAPSGRKEG